MSYYYYSTPSVSKLVPVQKPELARRMMDTAFQYWITVDKSRRVPRSPDLGRRGWFLRVDYHYFFHPQPIKIVWNPTINQLLIHQKQSNRQPEPRIWRIQSVEHACFAGTQDGPDNYSRFKYIYLLHTFWLIKFVSRYSLGQPWITITCHPVEGFEVCLL